MSAKRFQIVADLFKQALPLPPEKRSAFLRQASGGDDSIRAEVEALLARNATPPTYLRDSQVGAVAATHARRIVEVAPAEHPLPARIAKFDILDVLGEGGMGVVYRARQKTPNRLVAVKVLRAGGSSPAAQRRFQFEANALGRLQHPNIAQIFDAGIAEDGASTRPYFVMELIEGRPLTTFARERNLNVPDRLRLMVKICRAVDHAHQQGIVHRDLKPANILVTHAGEPKVLDFGIAKAVAARDEGPRTQRGQMIGTIPYMSPEQVNGDVQSIGPSTDIYALGIVLFELLEGEVPYRLDRVPAEEAVQIITCEKPAPPLSTSMFFRADLEGIIARCLAPRAADRYHTAEALALDLERFITNRPVLARRRSAPYRFMKFVIRHRFAAAFVLVVLVGASAGGWLVARAMQEEPPQDDAPITPAEPEPVPVEELAQDYFDMRHDEAFVAAHEWAKSGQLAGVIAIVEKELAKVPEGSPMAARGANRNRTLLAIAYATTGRHAEAERLLRKVLEGTNPTVPLRPAQFPEMGASWLLGWAVLNQGRAAEAKGIFQRVAGMERILSGGGQDSPRVAIHDAKVGMGLALLRTNDDDAAETNLVQGVAGLDDLLKDVRHPMLQRAYRAMVELYERTNRRNEALAWRQKLIE